MEVKRNLNNVQRKMLDQIYTEQFSQKERAIIEKRDKGYETLKQQILESERKSPAVRAVLEAGKRYFELVEKNRPQLASKSLSITQTIHSLPQLEFGYSYSRDGGVHPKLSAYSDETTRIRTELAQKKQEVRARIYGLATTFDEVKTEVEAIINTIKV